MLKVRLVSQSMAVLIIVVGLLQSRHIQADENITFTIIDAGYQLPDVVIPVISIHADGSLSMPGGKLDDDALKNLLKRTRNVKGKQFCLVRLLSSEEKDVSIHLLGETLQRIRLLSDSKTPTVIYVYLRELPTREDKPR
jgi:uncharacterized protein YktB (UPF0637 family)